MAAFLASSVGSIPREMMPLKHSMESIYLSLMNLSRSRVSAVLYCIQNNAVGRETIYELATSIIGSSPRRDLLHSTAPTFGCKPDKPELFSQNRPFFLISNPSESREFIVWTACSRSRLAEHSHLDYKSTSTFVELDIYFYRSEFFGMRSR